MLNERSQDIDVSFLRYNNKKKIIQKLCQLEQSSRSELSKELGISKPAISDNLEGLLSCGLVKEIGEGRVTAQGGRKPVLLEFNQTNKYILSVDFNVTNPIFVLSDLCGNIKQEIKIHVSRDTRRDEYASILHNGLSYLINFCGIDKKKIYCVAIAVPGVFDHDGKLVTCNTKFRGAEWCQVDFGGDIQSNFNLHTIVMNDVKAAAIGEWNSYGHDSDESMLYISCGEGLGSGIIINGRLYTGANNSAGEIYNYTDRNRIKHGGNVEEEICIHGFIRRVNLARKKAGDIRDPFTDFASVIEGYKCGDPLVHKIADDICEELAIIVLNYVNFMAFTHVVFGGEYVFLYNRFCEIFHEKYEKHCVTVPHISLAKKGEYSGVFGLVHLAREQYFEEICRI